MVKSQLKKLTSVQRQIISGKVMDLGNLVFIGLVITQLVPNAKSISVQLILVGVIILIAAYVAAYKFMKGK